MVSSDVTHMICVPRGWSHQHPGICTRPLWPDLFHVLILTALCVCDPKQKSCSQYNYYTFTNSSTQSDLQPMILLMALLSITLNLNSAYETWIFFPPGQLFDGYDEEYQCPVLDEDRVSELPHWTVEQRNTTMSEAERLQRDWTFIFTSTCYLLLFQRACHQSLSQWHHLMSHESDSFLKSQTTFFFNAQQWAQTQSDNNPQTSSRKVFERENDQICELKVITVHKWSGGCICKMIASYLCVDRSVCSCVHLSLRLWSTL